MTALRTTITTMAMVSDSIPDNPGDDCSNDKDNDHEVLELVKEHHERGPFLLSPSVHSGHTHPVAALPLPGLTPGDSVFNASKTSSVFI